MEKINVLILSRVDPYPGFLEDISAVSSRISVKDGVRQRVAEERKRGVNNRQLERVESVMDRVKGAEGDLDSLLAEAEVILGRFPQDMLEKAPNLKWMHLTSAGLNRDELTDFMNRNIVVTNSSGVTAIPIAEHALMFMFMLAKNGRRLVLNQEKRLWEGGFTTIELRNATLGLIGLGAIGSEIARLAKGAGMKVIAANRSAKRRETDVSGIDEIYPLDHLHELLHKSDFVAIAAPLTAETKGMIGEKEIKAMKKTAFIVNVARGAIVHETALIQALKEGWIAGAGLDVFETEPLPPDHELWALPNVLISPHMSGSTEGRPRRQLALFCDNLNRYINNEPMFNVIDWNKGY